MCYPASFLLKSTGKSITAGRQPGMKLWLLFVRCSGCLCRWRILWMKAQIKVLGENPFMCIHALRLICPHAALVKDRKQNGNKPGDSIKDQLKLQEWCRQACWQSKEMPCMTQTPAWSSCTCSLQRPLTHNPGPTVGTRQT